MTIEEKLKDLILRKGVRDIWDRDILIEEYFHVGRERERNILINLAKYLNDNSKNIEDKFSEKEIKKNILLKEIDYYIYKDIFFKESNLCITEDKKVKIQEYLDNFNKNKTCSLEKSLENIYFNLKTMLDERNYEYTKFNDLITKGIKIATQLHWKYLPIYKEQIMKNRGCLPEENIEEYYSHYHTIEDLYEEMIGKGIKFESLNGDSTLNQLIDFKVYTTRWHGYDTYRISRTIYGWEVNHISIQPETLKDGRGGLFNNLKHDYVFFPKEGVAYAMEKIWELADNGELSLNELRDRLQEVADWISDVERNMRVKQPKWCNYY